MPLSTRAPHSAKAEYRLRSPQPSNYRQHGALDYKSATRKQACALCLQRPSPPLCAIGAIDTAREAPMTLPLRHGSPPARYRANEEKNQGLRKGFFKATATRKSAHSLRFHKNPCSGSQASRPVRVRTRQHEKLSARFACWRQNNTYGGWHQWPDGAGQHVHNRHYAPGAVLDICMLKLRLAARAYTGYRVA